MVWKISEDLVRREHFWGENRIHVITSCAFYVWLGWVGYLSQELIQKLKTLQQTHTDWWDEEKYEPWKEILS